MAVDYQVVLFGSRFGLTANSGQLPELTDPLLLADGLTFSWEVTEGRMPSTFEPTSLTFNVAAAAAGDLDVFRIGERFQTFINVGTQNFTRSFTITDISIELNPHHSRRKARAQIVAVDTLAELRSRFADPLTFGEYASSNEYGMNIAAVARAAGIKLYAPQDMFAMFGSLTRPVVPGVEWPAVSVDESLAMMLDSGPWTANLTIGPDRHLTILPVTGKPAGMNELVAAWYPADVPTDPVAWNGPGYALVPHDRKQSGIDSIDKLPLAPTAGGAGLTGSRSSAGLPFIAAIDACHIEAPAAAQRSRGNGITTALVAGQSVELDEGAASWSEGATQVSSAYRAEYGTISREIPVFALVKYYPDVAVELPALAQNIDATVAGVASMFLSPADELAQAQQLDELTVRLSDMSAADAGGTLLGLTPAPPGSNLQELHRSTTPVVLYDLPPEVDPRTRYWGFAVAGELTIDRGQAAYHVTIAPGMPELIPDIDNPTADKLPDAHRYVDIIGTRKYSDPIGAATYVELALTRRTV